MRWPILVIMSVWFLPTTRVQADPVATISAVKGKVVIVGIDGVQRPANVNDQIMAGETIRTGNKGSVEIVLPDKSKAAVGAGAVLDPGEIIKFSPNSEEPSLLRRFFKWIGPILTTTDPEKLHIGGGYPTGLRGEINKPRTEYIASLARENDMWIAEISVLSGELRVDGVDYASLPERYFFNPLNKCAEELNTAAVLADVTPDKSAFQLLAFGRPATIQAGYWTRVEGIGPPLVPQLGIAPSHVNAEEELAIPEPASLCLIGMFVLFLTAQAILARVRSS